MARETDEVKLNILEGVRILLREWDVSYVRVAEAMDRSPQLVQQRLSGKERMSRGTFGGFIWLTFEILFHERARQLTDILCDAGIAGEELSDLVGSWMGPARAQLQNSFVALVGEEYAKDMRGRIDAAEKDALARRAATKGAGRKKPRKSAQAGKASKPKQPRAKVAKAKKRTPAKRAPAKRTKRKPKK